MGDQLIRVLGIETATASQSVALLEDQQVVADACWSGTGGGTLLPMIDSLLRKAGVSPASVDAVAVSVGPGSFTGVRVGLATGKGFALGTDAKVIGVSTLEALAASYGLRQGTVFAVLHAGRGELYAACYSCEDSELQALCAESVLSPEALAVETSLPSHGDIHIIGDAVAAYRERLEIAFRGRACVTDEGLRARPTAATVARLALKQIQRNPTGTLHDKEVDPVYLRRAEAELNWEKGLVKSPLERLLKAGL
jgi:tRNA threonylcarbamoyladenosine biosynthesis protein TsaB